MDGYLIFLLFSIFISKLVVDAFLIYIFDIPKGSMDYHYLAQNLLSGNGYVLEPDGPPNLWRPPLYPFFLAGIYGFFGQNHVVLVLTQIFFDLISCVILFLIGKTIFDRKTAFIAVMVWGFYPFSTYYTARIMTEPMFTLLLALLIYVIIKTKDNISGKMAFSIGAIQAFICLCKASMLYTLPLVAIYLFGIRKIRQYVTLRNIFLLFLGFFLFVSPWTIRNYFVSERFILISTPGGYAFWSGNYFLTDGRDDDELSPYQLELLEEARKGIATNDKDFMAPENSILFLKATIENIKSKPNEFVKLTFKKFLRFWYSIFHPKVKGFQVWVTILQLGILIPGFFGVYRAVKNNKNVFPILMIILYLVIIHTITSSTLRYSIPIMPYMVLFATYWFSEIRITVRNWTSKFQGSRFYK